MRFETAGLLVVVGQVMTAIRGRDLHPSLSETVTIAYFSTLKLSTPRLCRRLLLLKYTDYGRDRLTNIVL